jgi:hypothetical protein
MPFNPPVRRLSLINPSDSVQASQTQSNRIQPTPLASDRIRLNPTNFCIGSLAIKNPKSSRDGGTKILKNSLFQSISNLFKVKLTHAKSEISAVKKSDMKMSLISLYYTFYHFFFDAEVKFDKETVKFLAIFDQRSTRLRSHVTPRNRVTHVTPFLFPIAPNPISPKLIPCHHRHHF